MPCAAHTPCVHHTCRLYKKGKLPTPLELILCANETPVNFGEWCFSGSQPIWSPMSNEFAPLIPVPQWVARPDRDTDLSQWDPATAGPTSWDFVFDSMKAKQQIVSPPPAASPPMHKKRVHTEKELSSTVGHPGELQTLPCKPKHQHDTSRRACLSFCRNDTLSHCGWCKCAQCDFCEPHLWQHKESTAVFRGSLHRLNVYSVNWREQGPRRTEVTPRNWRWVGRTALIAKKALAPDLFNVNIAPGGVIGHSDHMNVRLKIPNSTWELLDEPIMMSFAEQVSRFKYAINIEGHGGWADRLYKLFLSPQLVLLQDIPARLWYEAQLRPWTHYVPVDSALGNLSNAVRWAQQHDVEAQAMVRDSNEVMQRWLTPSAIFRYEEELLLGYAQLFKHYTPARHPRAIRFTCKPGSEAVTCRSKGKSGAKTTLQSTQCFFDASRDGQKERRAGSLFEAALALGDAEREDGRKNAHSLSALQVLSYPNAHREPLDGSRLEGFALKHGLAVAGVSTASWH